MASMILDGVKGLQKTFNLYATTLGLLGLSGVIRWLNEVFELEQKDIKIFGFTVYEEYLSAIIGLLFGLFVVVLFLQIRFVSSSLKAAWRGPSAMEKETLESFQYFPWIACPLQTSKPGPVLFWSALTVGCLVVAWVAVGHIVGSVPNDYISEYRATGYYRAIGYVDLAILIGTFILLWRIRLYLREIRELLQEPKADS